MIDPKYALLLLLPLCLGGPLAPVLMWYAKRGQHRSGILIIWILMTVLYGLVGVAGIVVWLAGLPPYIWTPMLCSGIFPSLAYGFTFPAVRQLYARAEHRKSVALDI